MQNPDLSKLQLLKKRIKEQQPSSTSHTNISAQSTILEAEYHSSTVPLRPVIPDTLFDSSASVHEKICSIQNFISSFQYNYTGQPFIRLNRSLGMIHITASAKKLIEVALPIQCVEAVFLGCVLSADIDGLDRIPLSFKSKLRDHVHRHIVLALRYQGKWGSIGISRRDTLMDKEIVFDSLMSLIEDFKVSYSSCYHTLNKVYIGLPFSKNRFGDRPIKWRAISFRVSGNDMNKVGSEVENFIGNMFRYLEIYEQSGVLDILR